MGHSFFAFNFSLSFPSRSNVFSTYRSLPAQRLFACNNAKIQGTVLIYGQNHRKFHNFRTFTLNKRKALGIPQVQCNWVSFCCFLYCRLWIEFHWMELSECIDCIDSALFNICTNYKSCLMHATQNFTLSMWTMKMMEMMKMFRLNVEHVRHLMFVHEIFSSFSSFSLIPSTWTVELN